MQYYANKGKEYVRQQTQEISMKIKDSLKEYKIKEALDNIETLYAYKVELDKVVNIKQSCEQVRSKVTEIFQEAYQLINEDKNEIGKHRDERYKKFNDKFSILNKAEIFNRSPVNIDLNEIEQECLLSFEKKILEIVSYIENILNRFSTYSHLTRNDYIEFNIFYLNLLSFRQEMKLVQCGVNEKIGRIEKIETWARSAERDSTVQNVALMLINMKHISMHMPSFKTKINELIDELLNYYKNVTNNNMTFTKLGTLLNQDKTGIGQTIISEHIAFQDKLIENIKLIVGNIKQKLNKIEWDAYIRRKVPELAANIFASWTLKNAEYYFEFEGSDNRNNYLSQLHAAQVISIFCMLGIGNKDEELKNNLVQTGTREGKSITLESIACILALLGFDVRCACYSQYLNQRDYQALVPLFDALGLLNYKHYGTFNKLCEDIINDNDDIRQVVE
ncbi:unnamed protein product [Rotaria sp. Silwood2]|nr:unnamed protein product [Rotaria sp. Silwood2]CAF4613885.1 unnamed protein product [Rotaria sp. Silwood2]